MNNKINKNNMIKINEKRLMIFLFTLFFVIGVNTTNANAANDWNSTRSNKTSKTSAVGVGIGDIGVEGQGTISVDGEVIVCADGTHVIPPDECPQAANPVAGTGERRGGSTVVSYPNARVEINGGVQVVQEDMRHNDSGEASVSVKEESDKNIDIDLANMHKDDGSDNGENYEGSLKVNYKNIDIDLANAHKDDDGDDSNFVETKEGGEDPIPGIDVIVEKDPFVVSMHFDGSACLDCGEEPVKLSDKTVEILEKAMPVIQSEGWKLSLKEVDTEKYPKGTQAPVIPAKKIEHKKFLGLFSVDVEVQAEVNAQGEIQNVDKPWWSVFAW